MTPAPTPPSPPRHPPPPRPPSSSTRISRPNPFARISAITRTCHSPSPALSSSPHLGPALADDQPTIFLIALSDRTILPVIAYWVDGTTLNYVTLQSVPNQISLSQVDRDFSKNSTPNATCLSRSPPRASPLRIPSRVRTWKSIAGETLGKRRALGLSAYSPPNSALQASYKPNAGRFDKRLAKLKVE